MSNEKPPYLVQFAHGVLTSPSDPATTFSDPLPSFNPLPDQLPSNPFLGETEVPGTPAPQEGDQEPEGEVEGAGEDSDPTAAANADNGAGDVKEDETGDSAKAVPDEAPAEAQAADAKAKSTTKAK